MRVVLHIGMTKAGSTALQTGLSDLRGALQVAGALYPQSPVIRTKQPLLTAAIAPHRSLPRYLRHKLGGDLSDLDTKVESWFQRVAETVRAQRPAVLLLSDEWLFNRTDAAGLQMLAQRLRSLGDRVDVVVYVRRPSDHYLSMMQQTLKASHKVRQPQPTSYRATLEAYAKHVADDLWVFPYDRTKWPDHNILRHFLGTFLPGAELPLDQVKQRPNQSLSAEGIAILAEYRRTFWPSANAQFTPDTQSLIRALSEADADLGGAPRPQLHEPVRRFIDHASTDLLVLRDEHGIVFDGVDYDAVDDPHQPVPAADTVEDVCQVDATRKSQLALHALHRLAGAAPE